ncbi:Rossmann-fold NAD(P)-binding domain-containing protein [Streptomyces tunisiensis]|uniref:hypothetical protein n=1 Tax=Streptomyces tunisiensis TaxID=948699 RepID=UPI003988E78D
MTTWLITSVSSGFGRRMTEQPLAAGDRVVGTVRAPDAVTELKAAYGEQFCTARLDVTGFASVHQVLNRAFDALTAYDSTPAATVRSVKDAPPSPGGPAKMGAAIIASAGQRPAPLRLVLGSDAYTFVRDALADRLADVEAQKESVAATDVPAA